MIYDKAKVTDWGNVETAEKFYGVAVRNGRKYEHCIENATPVLFPAREAAEEYRRKLVASLSSRGLWKGTAA